MIEQDTIKYKFFMPYYDRCPIAVGGARGDVTLTSYTAGHTAPMSETRSPLGGVEFDASEHLKRNVDRDALYKWIVGESTGDRTDAFSKLFIAQLYIGESTLQFVKMPATRRHGESYAGKRTHLVNPNYPHRVSGVYIGTPTITENGTRVESNIKRYTIDSGLQIGAFTWEPTITSDAHVEFKTILDPYKETNETAPVTVAMAEKWKGMRSETWIYDCRTDGVFLRFMSHQGTIQQILLDISSTERTFTDGKLIRGYGLQSNEVAGGYVAGANEFADKTETEVIHAGLNGYADELFDDLADLAYSPAVAMYDKATQTWTAVRVTCKNIIKDAKRHKVNADFDIYTAPINSL